MKVISTDIIEACKNNIRSAQKQVYEHFFNYMYAVCRRYIRNEEETLEVLNDGFMNVFLNVQYFKGEGSFEAWVKRIIVNKALDHLKLNKKYRETLQYVEEYNEEPELIGTMIDDMYDIEELYHFIFDLPPVHRTVFNLYAIEGYSHKEIGGQLGISEGTSRWYLSESRKLLKEKIELIKQQA